MCSSSLARLRNRAVFLLLPLPHRLDSNLLQSLPAGPPLPSRSLQVAHPSRSSASSSSANRSSVSNSSASRSSSITKAASSLTVPPLSPVPESTS